MGEPARVGRRRRTLRDCSPCAKRVARSPRPLIAWTTSCSQFVPGKTTTAPRVVTGVHLRPIRFSCSPSPRPARSRGWRATWTPDLRRRRRRPPRRWLRPRTGSPARPSWCARPGNRAQATLARCVAPCGSAIPGRSRTSTRTSKSTQAPYQSARRRPQMRSYAMAYRSLVSRTISSGR